ncbi:hypothetical protein Hanom_Chr06g00557541 [Helianthus anomalus]
MSACYTRGPCLNLAKASFCVFCSFFIIFIFFNSATNWALGFSCRPFSVYPQTQTTHIEQNALSAACRLAGATPSSTPFFNLTGNYSVHTPILLNSFM